MIGSDAPDFAVELNDRIVGVALRKAVLTNIDDHWDWLNVCAIMARGGSRIGCKEYKQDTR